MIVCICAGVSHREIEAAIRDGATSLDELSRRTKVGLDCGECRDTVREMLARVTAPSEEPCPPSPRTPR